MVGTMCRKLLETIFQQWGAIGKKSTLKIALLNVTCVFICCLSIQLHAQRPVNESTRVIIAML
jgi:hypothetical protein